MISLLKRAQELFSFLQIANTGKINIIEIDLANSKVLTGEDSFNFENWGVMYFHFGNYVQGTTF